MIFFGVIFILASHGVPWVLEPKTTSAFSPAKLASLISLFTTVPYLVIIAANPEFSSISNYLGPVNFDLVILKFSSFYSLGFVAYLIGVYGRPPRLLVQIFSKFSVDVKSSRTGLVVAILTLVGIVAWYVRVQYAGGLAFLLQNISQRSALLAGSGIYALIMDAAFFSAMVLFTYSFRNRGGTIKKLMLVLLFIGFASMLSVFGGRKTTLYLMVLALMTWSLCVGRIRRPVRLAVPLVLFAVTYFLGVLLLRDSNSGIDYLSNLPVLFESIFSGLDELFANLSYVDTYIFILEHFSIEKFWFGAGFQDLLNLVMPFNQADGKPPIDDGVYVRSLFDGFQVFPPTAAEKMYPSSWPPESFGGGYMNFGLAGILGYMFLRGVVVKAAYTASVNSDHNPNLLYIYGFFVLNFHLTNLRLVQSAMTLAGAIFVALVYRALRKK